MMSQDSPTANKPTSDRRRAGRGWLQKFGDACRGVKIAVRAEASFFVHLFVTAVVVLAGAVLSISTLQWCILILCITVVLAAEMFNTALERLARAVTRETDPEIRDALDMASGAVLLASIGAVIVGMFVLGADVLKMLMG